MVDGVGHEEIFDCAAPEYTGTANTPLMHQTALNYETAVPDGGRLELKASYWNAKSRSFRCAGGSGRDERFRWRHPKVSGVWDDPIERSGTGTIYLIDPIIYSTSE